MDAKSLAQKLGITAKTVSQRARILGISGTQAKIEGKEGRPATVYNAEECDRIAAYGKAQTPVSESDTDDEDEAIDTGSLVLRNTIASPLAKQFGQMNAQLETLEDQAAQAIAQRVKAMPNRIMRKAAQKLNGYESLDLATIVGVLGCQPLALPARKIDPSLI